MEEKKVKSGSVAIGICLFVIAILLVLIVLFFYNSNIEKNNLQEKINQLEIAIEEKDEEINELNEEVNEQESDFSENLSEVEKEDEENFSKNKNYEVDMTKNQAVEEVNSNEEVNEPKNNFEQANNQEQEVNNGELNQVQNNFEQSNNEQEESNNEEASQYQEDIIEMKKGNIKGGIMSAFSLTQAEAWANYYMSEQLISREEYIANFYTVENIKNHFYYGDSLEVVGPNIYKIIDDDEVYFAKVTLSENMIVQNVEIFTEEEYNQ